MKLLIVTRCSACPFFEDSPLKKLGGLFVEVLLADSQHGLCCLLPSGEYLSSADLKIGLPPGSRACRRRAAARESAISPCRGRQAYDPRRLPAKAGRGDRRGRGRQLIATHGESSVPSRWWRHTTGPPKKKWAKVR